MEIMRGGSRASGTGSAEYFTGSVRQDPVVTAPEPARVRAVMVTFEPGARTAWHTHPLGQTLLVTSGLGRRHHRVLPHRPGEILRRSGARRPAAAPHDLHGSSPRSPDPKHKRPSSAIYSGSRP